MSYYSNPVCRRPVARHLLRFLFVTNCVVSKTVFIYKKWSRYSFAGCVIFIRGSVSYFSFGESVVWSVSEL